MSENTKEKEVHSIYGASGAKRWRGCPGSVTVIETAKALGDIPEDSSTKFSKEGDEAHDFAERILKGELSLEDVPCEEMRMHVGGYVYHCTKEFEKALEVDAEGAQEMVEGFLPLYYRSQDKGKVDHATWCSKFISFSDLKYGVGEYVEAEENDQQAIYAISMIADIESQGGVAFEDDLPVFLSIYQPRHRNFNGTARTWETTVRNLKDMAIDIEADYEKAKTGKGAVIPSDRACNSGFCDARGVCSAYLASPFKRVPEAIDPFAEFDEVTPEERTENVKAFAKAVKSNGGFEEYPVELLTPEQVAFICENGSRIKTAVDKIIDNEKARIKQGGELRSCKLVEGSSGQRQYIDDESEAEATKMLSTKFGKAWAMQPQKPLSVPQAIAKLGQEELSTRFENKFKSLWHQPKNQPKLVSIDAKGEALVFTATEDDFEDETEEGLL